MYHHHKRTVRFINSGKDYATHQEHTPLNISLMSIPQFLLNKIRSVTSAHSQLKANTIVPTNYYNLYLYICVWLFIVMYYNCVHPMASWLLFLGSLLQFFTGSFPFPPLSKVPQLTNTQNFRIQSCSLHVAKQV